MRLSLKYRSSSTRTWCLGMPSLSLEHPLLLGKPFGRAHQTHMDWSSNTFHGQAVFRRIVKCDTLIRLTATELEKVRAIPTPPQSEDEAPEDEPLRTST